jgi:hypothetical protein
MYIIRVHILVFVSNINGWMSMLSLLLQCGDIKQNPGPIIRNLKILVINARSLKTVTSEKNKQIQFKSLVAMKEPHVISVCETWLTSKVKTKKILSKKKYKIYRKDRESARGGGVLLAVSKVIKSKRRKDLESNSKHHNEMIAGEIKQTNGKRIGILTVYRPPDDLNYAFHDNLKNTLAAMWRSGLTEILILGDFNFPEIQWETGYPTTLQGLCFEVADTLQDFGMTQLNRHPSRDDTPNILDLILANHPNKVGTIEGYHDILSTDHLILDFTYKFNMKVPKAKPRWIYNYNKANFDRMNNAYNQTNWDFLDNIEDIDEALNTWEMKIQEVIERYVPKTRLRNPNDAPWIDGEVVHQSNKKERMRRKAKRTGLQRHWLKYKRYNQNLQNLIHRKFNSYVADCTAHISSNPKKFWTLVNNKQEEGDYPDSMVYGRESSETDNGKAELFNNFFGSVFTRNDPNEDLPDVQTMVNPLLENLTVEEREVTNILKQLVTGKASGPDNVCAKLLKECAYSIGPSLTKIINASLRSGTVPRRWKTAQVRPIHKKGEAADVTNYRPISLLCIPSKVMECCVYNRIIGELEPLITSAQHGLSLVNPP